MHSRGLPAKQAGNSQHYLVRSIGDSVKAIGRMHHRPVKKPKARTDFKAPVWIPVYPTALNVWTCRVDSVEYAAKRTLIQFLRRVHPAPPNGGLGCRHFSAILRPSAIPSPVILAILAMRPNAKQVNLIQISEPANGEGTDLDPGSSQLCLPKPPAGASIGSVAFTAEPPSPRCFA